MLAVLAIVARVVASARVDSGLWSVLGELWHREQKKKECQWMTDGEGILDSSCVFVCFCSRWHYEFALRAQMARVLR